MLDFPELYFERTDPPERAAEALRDRACIVIRGVIDKPLLDLLHRKTIAAFESDEDLGTVINRPRGRLSGSWLAKQASGDELLFERLVAEQLSSHLSAALGSPALHAKGHVRYRHHADHSTALPFHQHPHHDAGGELHLGRIRLVNVVIPFTDFDGTCPDLECVAKPIAELYPISETPETQFGSFELNKEFVLQTFGNLLWRPRMRVGDVCLFREGTLHRTFADHQMTRQRTSIDLRVFDAHEPLSAFAGAPAYLLPSVSPLHQSPTA